MAFVILVYWTVGVSEVKQAISVVDIGESFPHSGGHDKETTNGIRYQTYRR